MSFVSKLMVNAVMFALVTQFSVGVLAGELTGADIVQQCELDKNPGKDQRTRLTVLLRDSSGNEKKNVYRRYWKDFNGESKIEDKMILYTEFPPDAKGTGFMRWGYVPGSDKNADQWIYLPSLGTIRRVTVRDPGDSFLGSDLTYQDISPRLLSQDEHRYMGEDSIDGVVMYKVESIPKESNPLYGKVVSWFEKAPKWADCNKRRIEHFDSSGNKIKVQTLTWQKTDGAWTWDKVLVDNLRTGHSSVFEVSDVTIDVGLKSRMFSERGLKRPPRE